MDDWEEKVINCCTYCSNEKTENGVENQLTVLFNDIYKMACYLSLKLNSHGCLVTRIEQRYVYKMYGAKKKKTHVLYFYA